MRPSNLRVVPDTNLVVSAALFPQSRPRQALAYARAQGTVLVSTATIAELRDVFLRPRFDRYLPIAARLEFLDALAESAALVDVAERITACRDPRDDKFLELAVSGHATHIISGDQDLLALNPFRGIPILTPRSFLLDE